MTGGTTWRVSVFVGVSLDGFIARADHGLEWLDAVRTDPPEDTGYAALMASADAVVMGRRTYDAVLGFPGWPFARQRVTVLTHRPPPGSAHGETFAQGPLPDVLDSLRAGGARHVYLDGGVTVRQGLAARRVTHLTLSWVPVLLGRGVPLFGPDVPEGAWTLTGSQAFPSGLVQATYEARGT
ncbi:dihydrofolate reductase family protein [Deinococcus aquiradiocola]|uniref:dihydrofolate reductase family protein n=1 Tax=Deinococcus aquiradiocola TaxID=393059 RepID=UPI001669E8C5|nr:dihydrofolate reductase family protein [Deinococcus aquiradiocola]